MGLSVKDEPVIGFDTNDDHGEGKLKKKSVSLKKSGGFQCMGLSFPVLKGIQKRGYKVPTPIQRKTIPLVIEGRDIVAMARTGSGKTACFLIPLFEKLKAHSTQAGIRALILSPTRELALQTLKFTKELGRYTGLRPAVLLGGDSMESQFDLLQNNPDIVIATPGRFLHLCVEMDLKLNTVEYIVFDEADRLFEMGFGEQLNEIVARLTESRQTLLFSATLPKVLVEFARAGLSDPALIRLDVESKLPDTLVTQFVTCRPNDKSAALLCLLKHVIKPKSQTIIFAATKHHVEYLHAMLEECGIPNSYIYSDLDPSARKINAAKFQTGKVQVLVVTDVAARGIDIPALDNVINYHFPAKAKLFVHRVGRCARAGREGVAYSLVSSDEVPYLLDLALFLGRPSSSMLLGGVPNDLLESNQTSFEKLDPLVEVSENAYKQYLRSRPGASLESVRRAKELPTLTAPHPIFQPLVKDVESSNAKVDLLQGINTYRPPGTIFEIGQCSKSEMYSTMKKKRLAHRTKIQAFQQKQLEKLREREAIGEKTDVQLEPSRPEEVRSTFSSVILGRKRKASQMNSADSENYIHYKPADYHTEEGLAVNSFQRDASKVGLDLTGDSENAFKKPGGVGQKKWDRKRKRMVGDAGEKMVKSESGRWVKASLKSGRYKKWLQKTKAAERAPVEMEDEDDTKPSPALKKQPHTHWGRHNMKVSQRKLDLELKRPEQILKEREKKEKRKRRNGRKKGSKKKH